MARHTHQPRRHLFTISLLLAALLLGVTAAPQTLADPSPLVTPPALPQSCAPWLRFFGSYEWYDLLNNRSFDGTTCAQNWVFTNGYAPVSSSTCGSFLVPTTKIVTLPDAGSFHQDFHVPADVAYPLELIVKFATVGTPSSGDRIVLELRQGGLLVELRTIRTDLGPFNCREVVVNLGDSYAGESLRLRVRHSITTPGVKYHIDSVEMNGYIAMP